MSSILSLKFLLFLLISVSVYYFLPKKIQWVWLLLVSISFYAIYDNGIMTIVCIAVSTLFAYISTLCRKRDQTNRFGLILAVIAVFCNFFIWFVFRGKDIIWSAFHGIDYVLELWHLAVPLGVGYFTLQITGYIIDCYWGIVEPQRNYLKLLLFSSFFPQIVTGPISRYSQLEHMYEGRRFSREQFTFGCQRILWGFFKKLVIADRVAVIINSLFDGYGRDPVNSLGVLWWFPILLYPIQMYADFSGCMDIVIGAAQLFGIKLPENFNNPFFSQTAQEFWQRWHISLGAWAKDYVLYPLLKSKPVLTLSKRLKSSFGKNVGKFISTQLCMFVLWMVIGAWHGGLKYVIGVSLWYWLILALSEVLRPQFEKMKKLLHVNERTFSWKVFCAMRTYIIYAIGAAFFRASQCRTGFQIIRSAVGIYKTEYSMAFNAVSTAIAQVFPIEDRMIVYFGVFLMIIVGFLREKHGYARIWVKNQILLFRWAVWIGLFITVVIYGCYGSGFDQSVFIYGGF